MREFWVFAVIVVGLLQGCRGSEDVRESRHSSSPAEPQWVANDDVGDVGQGHSIDARPSPRPSPRGRGSIQAQSDEKNSALDGPVIQARHAEKIYRPNDDRMRPDVETLKKLGIELYESQRLRLFTDIDPEIARTLPALIDQAFATHAAYFGQLPPNREGTPYQMTGYLIKDRDRFIEAGVLPVELSGFQHGQHRGQEFWMFEQESDYYRRHLLIHEATHCYMMTMPGPYPPLWYLEGMAEYFGTHRLPQDGNLELGTMPDQPEDYFGFGRFELIHSELDEGRGLSLDDVLLLGIAEFTKSRPVPYTWSWALCKFLNTHPRYQARFQELGQHLQAEKFRELFESSFETDKTLLRAEWSEFVRTIDYGWNIPANAFVIAPNAGVEIQQIETRTVDAAKGWQSTGLLISAGDAIEIRTTGQVTLAADPQPWISEPQGVSIEYADGLPIGRLQAGVLPHDANASDLTFEVFDIGRSHVVTPRQRGMLMLRVNDFGNSRTDNRGEFHVEIQSARFPPGID